MKDQLTVAGVAPLRGRLRVPGDKSISHRALLFAAMADGRSRAIGLAGGDDVYRTRRALTQLGRVDHGRRLGCHGRRPRPRRARRRPPMSSTAGTRARRSAPSPGWSRAARSAPRCRATSRCAGVRCAGSSSRCARWARTSTVPTTARSRRSPSTAARWSAARTCSPVASAQVKTALVLAGLQASGVTEITEPHPSRDHTERMLTALGAPLERVDATTIRVRSGAAAGVRGCDPRRSVVGRVLVGRRGGHTRLRRRRRRRRVQPDAHRVRRRAPAHGRRRGGRDHGRGAR